MILLLPFFLKNIFSMVFYLFLMIKFGFFPITKIIILIYSNFYISEVIFILLPINLIFILIIFFKFGFLFSSYFINKFIIYFFVSLTLIISIKFLLRNNKIINFLVSSSIINSILIYYFIFLQENYFFPNYNFPYFFVSYIIFYFSILLLIFTILLIVANKGKNYFNNSYFLNLKLVFSFPFKRGNQIYSFILIIILSLFPTSIFFFFKILIIQNLIFCSEIIIISILFLIFSNVIYLRKIIQLIYNNIILFF